MSEESAATSEESVDIKAIMAEIREQIEERRHSSTAAVAAEHAGSLPAEFYDALIRAEEANGQLQPKMILTESSIPVIGPLFNRFRQNFHELVLFYVNQLASNQIQFNTHMIRALSILGEDVADSEGRET